MKRIILFVFLIFQVLEGCAQDVSDFLEKSLSAVVTVAVYKHEFAKKQLGVRGAGASQEAYARALDLSGTLGSGSGFVINKNGKKYIITNAHVVESASEDTGSIFVFSIDQSKYEVKVLGGDSFYDIAVLEFIDPLGDEISSLEFKQEEARIGERVYAIGNPLGEYPYSVTDGIISGKNRIRNGLTGKFGFLQTTATVIWGNSGGPLIDEKGKVVGINSQIAFATDQIGESLWQPQINFALEAGISEKLVNDILINDGQVSRAFIGVVFVESYDLHSIQYELGLRSQDSNPLVSRTLANSANTDVLQPYIGFVVKAVNGQSIRNLEELLGELEKVKPEDNVELILKKDIEAKVTLASSQLSTNNLEEIARDFLSQMNEFQWNQNLSNVVLQSRSSYQFKTSNFQSKHQKLSSEGQSETKYFLLAAGVVDDAFESLWRVENLQDLGAAVKNNSVLGVIDCVLVEEYEDDELTLYRQNLSNDDYLIMKTLFY